MKTLKSIMLGLALVIAGVAANASNKPTFAVLTKNDVLNIYVNAVVHGKTEGIENVFSNNIKYTMHRGEQELNLHKKQIVESFKASENIEQECTYTTSIIDESDKNMVVKLVMKYSGYTCISMVTISLNHNDFKITEIETSQS